MNIIFQQIFQDCRYVLEYIQVFEKCIKGECEFIEMEIRLAFLSVMLNDGGLCADIFGPLIDLRDIDEITRIVKLIKECVEIN